ncbi:hypothetical protein [Streptomyces sp. TE5632]
MSPYQAESAAEDDPHYGRQSCSTRTGPTATGNIADNRLSVVVGGRPGVRRRLHPLGAGHGEGWGWAASWHRPVFVDGPPMVPGLRVESVTVAHGRHELRVHRVVGAPVDSRVTHTGWTTGPDEPLVSSLHGLCGWDGPAPVLVRAPQGTAFTRWARAPRLTGRACGTSVHVSLASLTAASDPGPLSEAAREIRVDEAAIEVGWADGGARTRITFDPVEAGHPQQ